MLKLEFDAGDKVVAAALGAALTAIGLGKVVEGLAPVSDVITGGTPVGAVNLADAAEQHEEEPPEGTNLSEQAFSKDADVDAGGGDPATEDATAAAAPETDTRKRDPKGVPFDEAYCANAADPFNASGKRKDQWKKRRGVGQDDYDKWYAAELDALPAAESASSAAAGGVDTGKAFGAQAGTTEARDQVGPPANAGELMVWTSEQQAAGRLTQDDLGRAYSSCNLKVTDLFSGEPAEITANVAALYAILAPIAEAA